MTDTQVSLSHTSVSPLASFLISWPWTALDMAWLQFLKSHQTTSDPLHDLLALLVSHQMGRGHACLDLDVLLQDPAHLLDWTDVQIKALTQFVATSKHNEQQYLPIQKLLPSIFLGKIFVHKSRFDKND